MWASDTVLPPSGIAGAGHGSGLNADLIDGSHKDEFALDGHTHPLPTDFTSAAILMLPTSGITGAGPSSGLNADLLDGQESSAYAAAAHSHTQPSHNHATSEVIEAARNPGIIATATCAGTKDVVTGGDCLCTRGIPNLSGMTTEPSGWECGCADATATAAAVAICQ